MVTVHLVYQYRSNILISFLVMLFAGTLNSCDDFLEVAQPNSKISAALVFADDASATSAISGIYLDLYSAGSFASGTTEGLVSLAGLSADELINNPDKDVLYLDFQNNNVSTRNTNVLNMWTSMYRAIFEANSALERLANAAGVSAPTRQQLRGEALFVRAFCHFYLVNLFGDVPLVVSTDYRINAKLPRTPSDQVYDKIKNDLLEAEVLLPEEYVSSERIRPNKYTVQAFQARVYLYTKDWARAEDKATKLISASALYSLSPINQVFLIGSREIIWQIKPADQASRTNEGYTFGIYQGQLYNVLNPVILKTFEEDDLRKVNWVRTIGSDGKNIYLPYKYKKEDLGTNTTEYSVVFRLAEQYLIRSEARAQQGKLALAIADVDEVRERAGVALVQNDNPFINQETLLSSIVQERRLELFVEWGHRWLDLKRWNNAGTVLSPLKVGWSDTDTLYPIPESEILKNINLNPQNTGY